jgi:hypothetical protein
MSYENLLMQNVVASVEVTDDIPRRFITFMRGLVERPDDFHFKFGERICKIATLKSQFAAADAAAQDRSSLKRNRNSQRRAASASNWRAPPVTVGGGLR